MHLFVFAAVTGCLGLGILEVALRWMDLGDPPVFVAHPEIGYFLKPSQYASTRGHRFHVNQYGLRGADFTIPKPANLYRIVFVGDSITYGGGAIPDEELFVNQIPALVKPAVRGPVETISLSSPGWGIQNMSGYIGTRGCLDADLVVWVVPWADFYRSKTSIELYAYPVEKPLTRIGYLLTRLYLLPREVGLTRHHVDMKPTPFHSALLEQNVNALQRALSSCVALGSQAILVVVPSEDPEDHEGPAVSAFQGVAKEMAVSFLDLDGAFRQHAADSLFLDGVHLGVAGHRLVAEELAQAISTLQRDRPQ